ncbi:MAG: hypothetical protein BME94_08490, partial [Methanobacteriales archaeon Met13]
MKKRLIGLIIVVCLVLASSGCTNNTQLSESTGIPVSEAPNLASEISKSTGSVQTIQFKGLTLNMNQCMYILSKAIVMINNGEKGNIPIKTFSNAPSPSGTVNSARIAKNEYVDLADRTYQWMDQNGKVPNHGGVFQAGVNDLTPDMMLK